MKIAVTGANGFIGKHVVEQALLQGYQVTALIRSKVPESWHTQKNLTIAQCNLLQPGSFDDAIKDCKCIVHLAAEMSSDSLSQYSQTIALTENLLAAMDAVNIKRFIALSSISVLDYVHQKTMTTIDESISLNRNGTDLGFYALMKRDQEALYLQWQENSNKQAAILRAGLVYDEHHLSPAHAGFTKGGSGLSVLHNGYVPVVNVKSVADAIVMMISQKQINNEIIHLINDDLPAQDFYLKALKARGEAGLLIPIPWRMFAVFSFFIRHLLSIAGQNSKIPDSFRKNSVAARLKPFVFSNKKAKNLLGWEPESKIN